MTLADADALRAALAPVPPPAAAPLPAACPGDDPFVVPPDEQAKPVPEPEPE